jgi:hypothetical protein
MSKHYAKHAKKVVKGFREILDDNARNTISDEDYDQLAMLVESAISTSVLDAVERVADDLEKTVRKVRKDAERYDNA